MIEKIGAKRIGFYCGNLFIINHLRVYQLINF
jgi:hypothetical protein